MCNLMIEKSILYSAVILALYAMLFYRFLVPRPELFPAKNSPSVQAG